MTWILTATGNEVDMLHPKLSSINLASIAHHLSLINRFCGATFRPYSVAEHSLLVCDIVERHYKLNCFGLFAALMHDAHEAYTNDLATPAKYAVHGWREFEHRFERMVRSAFALHTAAVAHADAIRHADLVALATERQQLLPSGGAPWKVLEGIAPRTDFDLMSRDRLSFTWADWSQAFTDRADELDYERSKRAEAFGRTPTTTD